jgi:cytidyltransferase-like protein
MVKKKGYIDMVGDLFHFGHVNNIKTVYNLGYDVVIGIHSDITVESYKRKPILTMDERIKVIESCKYVFSVIKDAPLIITKEYLDKHNFDMVFHAHPLEEEIKYKKMYEIPLKLGKFTRTEYTVKISTTEIINRIIKRGKSDI